MSGRQNTKSRSIREKTKDALLNLKSMPEHMEVTLRIGIAMVLGYTVVFSDIMPIDTSVLLGILVPFCSMLFPTLMFAYGSLVLPLFGLFLFVYVSSTFLLSIVVVGGQGSFLAVFGIWCFGVTFLRFSKSEGFKTSVILIATIFQIVLVWPNYNTVENGFTLPGSYSPAVRKSLTEMIQPALDYAISLGPGTHQVDITSGGLEGQTANITINSDGTDSKTFVPGGMWIVRAMWTSTGIRNPLASYQGWMIFTCWLIFILGFIFLTPPFRTVRGALNKSIIPAALREAANSIRLFSERLELNGNSLKQDVDAASDIEEKRNLSRVKLTTYINTLFEGNLAKYTVFEPRLLAFKPAECTMEILVQLCIVTLRCLRIALAIDILTHQDDERKFLHNNVDQYNKLAATLEQCAQALSTGDLKVMDAMEGPTDNDKSIEIEEDNVEQYDPLQLKNYVSDAVALTRRWLNAMGPTTIHSPSHLSRSSLVGASKNLWPWIHSQISHVVYLLMLLTNLLKPSSWRSLKHVDRYDSQKFVWCIKYSIGFTALLAMSFYWPFYKNNFVVAASDDPNRGIYSSQNGGWAIASYCFATTQTTEGSVKKGILRMVGTIAGAFSAWLALLVCEDGRYSKQYNVVGLVAWMTVTSIIATYISTERGFAARISLSNDYSFGPIYFLIAQIIIVCNAFYLFEPEARNALAINRMFSNLVGILMSMVMAVIPPGNWGGDPGHCKAIVKLHWKTTTEVIRILLSCNLGHDGLPIESECKELADNLLQLREDCIQKSTQMQQLVVDFEKDAVRLKMLPRFQVDPKLKAEIAKVTRDVHIAAFMPQVAARILLDPNGRSAALGVGGPGREELTTLLKEMENKICYGVGERVFSKKAKSHDDLTNGEIDVELFFRAFHFLRDEMVREKKGLDGISWGF